MKLRGRSSLTTRLTLLFAFASTMVLLLLGLVVGKLVERHFEELDDEVLRGKLTFLQRSLARVDSAPQLQALSRQLEDALADQPGVALIVVGPDGHNLLSTGSAEFPGSLLIGQPGIAGLPQVWTTTDRRRYRGLAGTASTPLAPSSTVVIAAATDMAHHDHFMVTFRIALWSVMALAAVLTGFLGWVAVRRGLAPLETIRQSASGITADRLDHRLSADAIPGELAEVVDTLNEMLGRLQESFRRLSDFSSDLAHELRTPVANLLTQTQVVLSKLRSPEEYRETLASNDEELERLARVISDMLFLAKSDNALIVPGRERVDLRREVDELFEFYDALAEEKGITMTVVGDGSVSGDKLMLRRAVSNLLSNAIRHTPPAGHIRVLVERTTSSMITLAVENSGETIAPEHLPRLFDRFYRVSTSRHREAEGAGLGLAITLSIVRAHGGELSVSSSDGLTRFDLRIPAA